MGPYEIIKKPLITEKTTLQKEQYNQYTFEVDSNANRIEIRDAVESVFSVRVYDVKTMNIRGKKVRRGRIEGKKRNWKKAVVSLMPGERIEFFEGA